MSDNRRNMPSHRFAGPGEYSGRRREERYRLFDIHRKYVAFFVKSGPSFVSAVLYNFSRHGVMLLSPAPYEKGMVVDCRMAITSALSKDVFFTILVRHCREQDGQFLIGASIESVTDETWFDIVLEVRDFMAKGHGDVY